MTPTLTKVRTALQNLAAKKGRPDYELCTAKAVKRALENGLEHHLIEDVLPLIAVPSDFLISNNMFVCVDLYTRATVPVEHNT